MSLKWRIILILCGVMVVYVLVNGVLERNRITSGFGAVEADQAAKDMNRCLLAMQQILDSMELTAIDWGEWDDTCDFVANRDFEYVSENMPIQAIQDLQITMMMITDKQGNVIALRAIDPETGREAPPVGFTFANLRDNYPELMCYKETDRFSGVHVAGGVPYLVVTHPVYNRCPLTGPPGPVVGSFMTARRLDKSVVAQISESVSLPMQMHALKDVEPSRLRSLAASGVESEPVSARSLKGYALVKDALGKPVAVFSAKMPRNIMAQGQKSVRAGAQSLIVMAVLLAVMLLILLDRMVLRPIVVLSREISQIASKNLSSDRVSQRGCGEVGRLAAVFNEMLERRQAAEDAVRAGAERLEAIIEKTPLIAVHGFDRQGVIMHWNPVCEAIYGYSREEAVGTRVQDLILPKVDIGGIETAIEEIWITGKPTPALEWNVRTKYGEERIVYSTMFPVSGRDGLAEIFCMNVDITGRKAAEESLRESEERFRSLLGATSEGIIIHDDGVILDANHALEMLTGFTLADIIGVHASDLVAEEDRPRILERARTPAGANTEARPYEVRYRRKDGTVFSAEVVSSQHTYRGRTVHTLAIHDITERKQTEEELRRMLTELERFNRLSIGREMRMVELKREVNAMASRAGQPAPYDLSFSDEYPEELSA